MFIKYCFFFEYLKYSGLLPFSLFSLGVSVCTHARQVGRRKEGGGRREEEKGGGRRKYGYAIGRQWEEEGHALVLEISLIGSVTFL